MSALSKLMQARKQLRATKLQKSGRNTFANYNYFELGDFLHPTLEIFDGLNLCGVVSFDKEIARLVITDLDDNSFITITSPMGSAALKGCHEVQNIGAVETYQRRYLWVTAMEIVEHDALDATTGKAEPDKKALKQKPTDGSKELVPPVRQKIVERVANATVDLFNADDLIGAYGEYIGIEDAEERTYLQSLVPANIRSALKKHHDFVKQTETA